MRVNANLNHFPSCGSCTIVHDLSYMSFGPSPHPCHGMFPIFLHPLFLLCFSRTAVDLTKGGFKCSIPAFLWLGTASATLPFHFTLRYCLWVYLGNAQRRERNPAGRGDWVQEGGMFFFSFFFSFLWLRFSIVMGSSSRGSRRSRQRQSQRSSDLVRNAAVLYCFSFFHPPFVSLDCVWLQCSAQMFSESFLL